MSRLNKKPLTDFVRRANRAEYAAYDDQLKEEIRQIGARNLFLQKRLHEITASFAHAGVRAVVLKGMHLVQTVYPFGIRPIEDIDLFIDRDDFDAADRILTGMGYEDCAQGMDRWTHEQFSRKITYVNRQHPVIPIDIHFSLGPYPYLGKIGPELVWANTETLASPNGSLLVLQPELLLIHLCLHLYQHHFDDWLVSCCDIAAFIRNEGGRIDWRKFYGIAETRKLQLPIRYSLDLVRQFADIRIPAPEEAGVAVRRPGRLEAFVFQISQKQHEKSDRYFLQYLTTPGISLKMKGALKILYPGRALLDYAYLGSYVNYIQHIIKTAAKLTSAVFTPGKK